MNPMNQVDPEAMLVIIEQRMTELRAARQSFPTPRRTKTPWRERAVTQLNRARTASRSTGRALENRNCSPVVGCSNPKV